MLATTLGEAIGSLLPAAVAVAISPIPIIAIVIVLGTPRARVNGPAFGVGWIVGLATAAAAVLVVTNGVAAASSDSDASLGTSLFQLVLGVLLLGLSLKEWRSRPGSGEEPELPKWMSSVDHLGAAKTAALGALLSGLNPKNLILAMSAGAAISQAGLSNQQDAIAVVVFVAIGSFSVVGAVMAYLVGGSRASDSLASIKTFMSTHNSVIMAVLLLVIGAKVLGEGIAGLSA